MKTVHTTSVIIWRREGERVGVGRTDYVIDFRKWAEKNNPQNILEKHKHTRQETPWQHALHTCTCTYNVKSTFNLTPLGDC